LGDLASLWLGGRDVLHVQSVDSHDGINTLPERVLAAPCGLPTLTEPLSSEVLLGAQARLPHEDELSSATASMMDCALETQAGSVNDDGVLTCLPGMAAAEVW
jgi:hypothetical protein